MEGPFYPVGKAGRGLAETCRTSNWTLYLRTQLMLLADKELLGFVRISERGKYVKLSCRGDDEWTSELLRSLMQIYVDLSR